ncbi:hypothetical protein [Arthrobacter sp. Soc17.1.1.1]|uniref:hypothetical protein n=1 Tax=Arthrobacter sp. Soc17.1.1.1 TaxID=3121277 RepID=UPI003FA552D5
MQVGEAELAEVGDPRPEADEIPGVEIHVADAAEHPVGGEPVRCHGTGCVESLEARGPVLPGCRGVERHLQRLAVRPGAVDAVEQRL